MASRSPICHTLGMEAGLPRGPHCGERHSRDAQLPEGKTADRLAMAAQAQRRRLEGHRLQCHFRGTPGSAASKPGSLERL